MRHSAVTVTASCLVVGVIWVPSRPRRVRISSTVGMPHVARLRRIGGSEVCVH